MTMIMMKSSLSFSLSLLWLLSLLSLYLLPIQGVYGILPTVQLTVFPGTSGGTGDRSPYTLLASQAFYGPLPPMEPSPFSWGTRKANKNKNKQTNDASSSASTVLLDGNLPLVFPPLNNPLLCENITIPANANTINIYKNAIIVVPRGECTYQMKTYVAQERLGAAAVVLYNTLASRYSINTTTHKGEKYPNYSIKDVIFPQEYNDYDCNNGQAIIPTNDLVMHPLPYNATINDPLLSGNTNDNLCKLYSNDNNNGNSWQDTCESHKCLITSWNEDNGNTKVCCAWDLHLWLYPDSEMQNSVPIKIPTIFLTMNQGDQLVKTMTIDLNMATLDTTRGAMTQRWKSDYNLSSIIIWILGVCVAAIAAYWSASDYHQVFFKLQKQRRQQSSSSSSAKRNYNTNDNNNNTNNSNSNNNNSHIITRSPMQEETLELEPIHAVGFVVMASTTLLILFYFKIYNVVKVMYAIGCSNSLIQVIMYPLVSKCLRKLGCAKPKILYKSTEFGDITNWDLLAAILGYMWGMIWLYMALRVPHPDTHLFFWVTQDILGACMCIVFLGLIQLNSIQVASILLIVAFAYDIFFVFISPYIFQKSVMITVATSGGPPSADPLWCEKYPSDPDCQGGDPLPMLLTIPRIWDYQGGSSMLGLGDIVLPGLLLSFAARLDAAKALVGMVSGGRQVSMECQDGAAGGCCSALCCCFRGYLCGHSTSNGSNNNNNNNNGGRSSRGYYFIPVVIAYAVGLLMANIAVYVMNMGQPALLYLVPCTLGTMTFLGWKRHELKSLWEGPSVLRAADEIVYGRPEQQQQQQQRSASNQPPQQQGGTGGVNAADVEGGEDDEMNRHHENNNDDDEGDVPLLQPKTQQKSTIT